MSNQPTGNQPTAAQPAKSNRPPFPPMTRKQISLKYHITPKTLRKWCEDEGLKLPTGLLSPMQVERMVIAFGEWPDASEKSSKDRQ